MIHYFRASRLWWHAAVCALVNLWGLARAYAQVPPTDLARSGEQQQPSTQIQEDAARMKMVAKLEEIILPEVSFANIRLADVLEVLRRESVRQDEKSPPGQRGVKIIAPLPPTAGSSFVPSPSLALAAPEPDLPDTPITIYLDHPTLAQALGAVAEKIGRKLKVDGNGVQLVSCYVDCQPMLTREFHLPTALFRSRAGMLLTAGPTKYLESCGIRLPLGASVQYIPATQKLIARNTQENIDYIEAAIESLVASANGTALIE